MAEPIWVDEKWWQVVPEEREGAVEYVRADQVGERIAAVRKLAQEWTAALVVDHKDAWSLGAYAAYRNVLRVLDHGCPYTPDGLAPVPEAAPATTPCPHDLMPRWCPTCGGSGVVPDTASDA